MSAREDRRDSRNQRIEDARRNRLVDMILRMAERHVKSKRGASWAEMQEALESAAGTAGSYADYPHDFPEKQP